MTVRVALVGVYPAQKTRHERLFPLTLRSVHRVLFLLFNRGVQMYPLCSLLSEMRPTFFSGNVKNRELAEDFQVVRLLTLSQSTPKVASESHKTYPQ